MHPRENFSRNPWKIVLRSSLEEFIKETLDFLIEFMEKFSIESPIEYLKETLERILNKSLETFMKEFWISEETFFKKSVKDFPKQYLTEDFFTEIHEKFSREIFG